MPKLVIDGKIIEVEDGVTVLQACEIAGKEIPHFCFHERLNIAGNCRMCLVEIEKSPKPVASCAMPVQEGMIIHTDSSKIRKARHGVMEMLLINHPLDCPICDKGGECDLQDQAYKYGLGENRFAENKRSVKDKYMGPLIKTHMTRCIHCTRCIRFATEVAGVQDMGAIYRGEHMEVTSYLDQAVTSELSGNMIDLCPVGALTSKPYAYKARSWELVKTESIDVSDALGSNIRVDTKGLEVMRVLPKICEDINEEWISDKARFSYDGLKYQRLDAPYIRTNGKLLEVSWSEALATIADRIKTYPGRQIAAIAGNLINVEALFCLKKLFSSQRSNNLAANQFSYKIDTSSRGNYLFNTAISGIEKADLCLLIGANPRLAAPVLNARIGKMQRQGVLNVFRIGTIDDQTYKITDLGDDVNIISRIITGNHEFSASLKAARNPMLIIGDGVYGREDGYAILALIHTMLEKYPNFIQADWNGFNILHNHAATVGALDIGFMSEDKGFGAVEILKNIEEQKINFLYLLGADEIDMTRTRNAFVVYQGHHGDAGAAAADVILPSCSYVEQDSIYVNLEGRPQFARAALPPLGQAKEDWRIIRDLANILNVKLPDNLNEIRTMLAGEAAVFADIGNINQESLSRFTSENTLQEDKKITKAPINYYMTDVISRASVTMARCSRLKNGEKEVA